VSRPGVMQARPCPPFLGQRHKSRHRPRSLPRQREASSIRSWASVATSKWGVRPMTQYIMLVNFTDQGLKGVKDVPNRQDKSRETAKQLGVERKIVCMQIGP